MVVAALVTRIHCLLEESLQPLEPDGGKSLTEKDKPQLHEFYDHAEYKGLTSREEEIMETLSTTELPELLPTPVALKLKESDAEVLDTDKKLSVPKKGLPFKKSSVVPKKEVHFTPSVVAKKGADPESSTPSVSPRKGVGSQVNPLLLVSSENMNNTNVSPSPSDAVNSKNLATKISETEKVAEENSNNRPLPQLIQSKEKSNDSLLLVKEESSQPPSDSLLTVSSVVPPKSDNVSNISHFKPATADDAGAAHSQVSYAPIVMIVALVVLVVVVLAVAYHRLKDIWVRRHYDYVDFLIDGMYE